MPNEQPDQLPIDDSGPRVRLAVPAMTGWLALLVAFIPYCHAHTRRRSIAAKQIRGIRFFDVEPPILKSMTSRLTVQLPRHRAIAVARCGQAINVWSDDLTIITRRSRYRVAVICVTLGEG